MLVPSETVLLRSESVLLLAIGMTITCLEQLKTYGQNTSSIKQQAKRNRRKLGEFHEIPMESNLQNQEINADDEFISGTV